MLCCFPPRVAASCCAVLYMCLVFCSWKVTRAQYDQIVSATKSFSEDSLQFMSKVLHRSGLGDETYAPPSELAAGLKQTACSCWQQTVCNGALVQQAMCVCYTMQTRSVRCDAGTPLPARSFGQSPSSTKTFIHVQ